jgi:tyrosyl-tRNA synthetase
VFKQHQAPEEMVSVSLDDSDPVFLPALIVTAGLTKSSSEARRMLSQGAVKVDGVKVADEQMARADLAGRVLQVGKRRFVRLA